MLTKCAILNVLLFAMGIPWHNKACITDRQYLPCVHYRYVLLIIGTLKLSNMPSGKPGFCRMHDTFMMHAPAIHASTT